MNSCQNLLKLVHSLEHCLNKGRETPFRQTDNRQSILLDPGYLKTDISSNNLTTIFDTSYLSLHFVNVRK